MGRMRRGRKRPDPVADYPAELAAERRRIEAEAEATPGGRQALAERRANLAELRRRELAEDQGDTPGTIHQCAACHRVYAGPGSPTEPGHELSDGEGFALGAARTSSGGALVSHGGLCENCRDAEARVIDRHNTARYGDRWQSWEGRIDSALDEMSRSNSGEE